MEKYCPSCHAKFDDSWKKDSIEGYFKCPFCGCIHDMDGLSSETGSERRIKSDAYERVYGYLKSLRFSAANDELRTLRNKYKEDSRVYFLSVLSDNCVCYTENDDKTKWPYDKIPTLNNITFSNILESEYVKKAISLAKSNMEKDMYQKTFEYMESVRDKIEKAYKNGENRFDVFISTKVNKVDSKGNTVLDEFGDPEKTSDYRMAEAIYELIRKEVPGCRVFLSEKMKDLFLGKEYENIIFSALHTSKVFILVGNSRENVDWHWVRNEWMRYLYLMDPNTSEDAENRKFLFVTRGMNPSDIPSEFKKRQHIFWQQEVGAEINLIKFVREGVRSNQVIKKIESKEFETSVGKVKRKALEEMKKSSINFGANYDEVDEDVALLINSAIRKLERANEYSDKETRDAKRSAAFRELESIVDSHKDAYKARLYLLLDGTKYSSPEDYFSDVNEIANNPDFAEKYFENAELKDAKKMIKKVVDTINGLREKQTETSIKNIDKTIKNVIVKYLDHISKTSLPSLSWMMKAFIDNNKSYLESTDLVDSYLYLMRYIDGDDPEVYIRRRADLLPPISEKRKSCSKVFIRLADEILSVDPGNINANWYKVASSCYGCYATPSEIIKMGNCPVELGDKENRKKWIESFTTLFSVAPTTPDLLLDRDLIKSSFLRLFLTTIISSSWSYTPSKSSSSSLESSKGKEDYELNGYDLFNKYIAYDLGDSTIDFLPSSFKMPSIDQNKIKPLLEPGVEILKYSKNDSHLTSYILQYATNLHKKGIFLDAIRLYELYIAQQEDVHAFDCVIVRFYIELAKNGCTSTKEQMLSSFPLNVKSIKLDLFKLSENGKKRDFEKVSDAIEAIEETGKAYIDVASSLRKILSSIPEVVVDNYFVFIDIKMKVAMSISSIKNQDIKTSIQQEFSGDIKNLDDIIASLASSIPFVLSIFYKQNSQGVLNTPEESWEAFKGKTSLETSENPLEDIKASISTLKGELKQYNNPSIFDALLGEIESKCKERENKIKKAKSKKAIRNGLIIGTISLAVVSLALTFTVFVPSGNYNKGIQYFESGDYSNASKYLDGAFVWKDAKKKSCLAKAALAFDEDDYERGISYVEDAGGVVDISYDANGGTMPSVSNLKLANTIKKTPKRNGYVFQDWGVSNYEFSNKEDCYDCSLSLYAKWELEKYTITFVGNGGTHDNHVTYYTMEDAVVLSPAYGRVGYNFVHWVDQNGKIYDGKIEKGTQGNLTLTAVWSLASYVVNLYSNNYAAGTLIGGGYHEYGENVTISATPNKGYELAGWYNEYNTYLGQTKSITFKMPAEDVSYTAKWHAIEYKIIYDISSSETNDSRNPTKYTVEDDNMPLYSPTRVGYEFLNWTYNGESIEEIDTSICETITLKATWKAIEYPITYVLNGGVNNPGNKTSFSADSGAVYFLDPTREGYKFDGWYYEPDFRTKTAGVSYSSHKQGVSVYAKWTPISYTITYDLGGGKNNPNNPESYTIENGIISLQNPTKYSNEFLGWKYEGQYLTEIDPTWCKDITLTAEWQSRAMSETEKEMNGIVPSVASDEMTLTYGLYPQTVVRDASDISHVSLTSSGYYLDSSTGAYYYPYTARPYNSSYKFDDGSPIVAGTTYWFRCEPITWKVLSTNADLGTGRKSFYVVSDKLLDAHRYNELFYDKQQRTDYKGDSGKVYANNYKYSEIRAWLNTDFYDLAFSLDNSFIETTAVNNSYSTYTNTSNSYACENTFDKVYLPSVNDYESYGFSSSYGATSTRYAKTTDFARARGAYSVTSNDYPNNGNYWTRSPDAASPVQAQYINYEGKFYDAINAGAVVKYYDVDSANRAVRPALTLTI